jgi:hypothetical protein
MEVLKGYLLKTSEGGARAQVRSATNEIIDNVLMLYPYGSASNMQREEEQGSMVLLLKSMGSKTNIFGIPYNPLLQPQLEPTEKAVGNFKQGNKITFKANGDIEVFTEQNININCADMNETATGDINQTATGSVNIDGASVNLGDAVALVLNTTATILDSGGGTCTIVSPGQTKVSA